MNDITYVVQFSDGSFIRTHHPVEFTCYLHRAANYSTADRAKEAATRVLRRKPEIKSLRVSRVTVLDDGFDIYADPKDELIRRAREILKQVESQSLSCSIGTYAKEWLKDEEQARKDD